MLLAFNKPFNVLSQFTGEPHLTTLAEYIDIPNVYPAGRLDKDSEGLLLLTNHGPLQARIAEPKFKLPKTYWVLVEGEPTPDALAQLRIGVELKDGRTKPALVKVIDEPENLWPRNPPVRIRKSIQDTWLELTINEGKNRQVRRMTAHIGFPTLRLIRASIGSINLNNLGPSEWRYVSLDELPPKLLSALKK
ncbi:pseudouridine synthase [Lysobacter sp. N42]|uniref:pseudouridine synthase n=1 Tax=Lysobacter sp. N42 TaxID=2545719 RepID=UPI001A9F1BA3|nr:pseudouridine synthase [Lysobacter sp. N42]